MKTILAKRAGFCFGVKNAVKKAQKTNYPIPVFTLGDIVHNKEVVNGLIKKGVKVINTISQIQKGTVIIRAHGIPKKIIRSALAKKINVIDATCPFVKAAQNKAIQLESQKYQVIVLGERNHPEIKGIAGNLKKPIIVENISDAQKIKEYKKIGFISQTTQEAELFNKILKIFRTKTKYLKAYNTICSATSERQKAAKKLAKKVDIMIVIGGKDSGNTRRLFQICKKIVDTYHIETANELKKEWFGARKICGITAGASTPNWIIKGVAEKIKRL